MTGGGLFFLILATGAGMVFMAALAYGTTVASRGAKFED